MAWFGSYLVSTGAIPPQGFFKFILLSVMMAVPRRADSANSRAASYNAPWGHGKRDGHTGRKRGRPTTPKPFPVSKAGRFYAGRLYLPEPRRQKVLTDVSFQADPGDRIAIVGPAGQAKPRSLTCCCGFMNRRKATFWWTGKTLPNIRCTRVPPPFGHCAAGHYFVRRASPTTFAKANLDAD